MIVSKKGISAEISNALAVAYANNGNPVVQVGPNTKVVWYNPAYSANKNGSMLNVPGNNEQDISLVNALQHGPLEVRAGDILVITKSAANPNPRPISWPEEGWGSRSNVDEAMAIAFVSYTPIEGQLFPPAIGKASNPIVSFFRSVPILKQQVDNNLNKLTNKYDLATVVHDGTNWSTVQKVFSDFWLEGYNGWSTDTKTPAYQHPGYGRDVAWYVSKALLYLNSTATITEKARLAYSMVEQGLSLVTAFADGRAHQANGGHMQGRKALLILAGYLLGIPQITNPNWVGNIFQEDHMHRREPGVTWWFGDWDVLWRRASEFRHPCDIKPSTWTENEKWAINGYYWPSCGANLGTAMAMTTMGLKDCIGKNFVDGIKQFMQGPPQDAKQELIDNGMPIPWGRDYPYPWNGLGIQEQLYKIHGI